MKPRRRTILNMLLLLAAGATLNVAVAWGLAVWELQDQPFQASREQFNSVKNQWGPPPAGAGKSFVIFRHASGFPLRSLESYRRHSSIVEGFGARLLPEKLTFLIAAKDPLLPTRIIWPGFAVNTLFYAGVLWVLCCGPFALRRMIRRRRGQCPHCAYPIGQSPVCTECGAAVMSKMFQS